MLQKYIETKKWVMHISSVTLLMNSLSYHEVLTKFIFAHVSRRFKRARRYLEALTRMCVCMGIWVYQMVISLSREGKNRSEQNLCEIVRTENNLLNIFFLINDVDFYVNWGLMKWTMKNFTFLQYTYIRVYMH